IPIITVDVAGNFSDPDGDSLTFLIFSMVGSPATATLDASGSLTISRNPIQTGSVTVTITAIDAKGAMVWDDFQVDMR
ncbi:Ig-like domain-containing protein, partial [Brevibacillus reuszeri]|uniref:Ig-like domain-containing protein n=1 Tax=Brevibacillus reuszeri TaxID=54915 RepID=UPI002100E5FE